MNTPHKYSVSDGQVALAAVCSTIGSLGGYEISKFSFDARTGRWYAIQGEQLVWFEFSDEVRVAMPEPTDALPVHMSTPCLPNGPQYSINVAPSQSYVIAAHDGSFEIPIPEHFGTVCKFCVFAQGHEHQELQQPIIALWTTERTIELGNNKICVWRAGEWVTIELPFRQFWHSVRYAMALGGADERVLLLHQDAFGNTVHIVDVSTQKEVATVTFDHTVLSIVTVGTYALLCFGTDQLARLDLTDPGAPPTMVDMSKTTLGMSVIVGLAAGGDQVGLLCAGNTCAWLDPATLRVAACYKPPLYKLIATVLEKVREAGLRPVLQGLHAAIEDVTYFELTGVLDALYPTYQHQPVSSKTAMPSLGRDNNPTIAKHLLRLGYMATFELVESLLRPMSYPEFNTAKTLRLILNDTIRADQRWGEAFDMAVNHTASTKPRQFTELAHVILDNGATVQSDALLRLANNAYFPDHCLTSKLIEHGADVNWRWPDSPFGSLGSLALYREDLDFLLRAVKFGYQSERRDVEFLLNYTPYPPGFEFERWLWLFGLTADIDDLILDFGGHSGQRGRRFLNGAFRPWSCNGFAMRCYWQPLQEAAHAVMLVAQRWAAAKYKGIGQQIDIMLWYMILSFLPCKPSAWRGTSAAAAFVSL